MSIDPGAVKEILIGVASANFTGVIFGLYKIISVLSSIPEMKKDLDLAWQEIRKLRGEK